MYHMLRMWILLIVYLVGGGVWVCVCVCFWRRWFGILFPWSRISIQSGGGERERVRAKKRRSFCNEEGIMRSTYG